MALWYVEYFEPKNTGKAQKPSVFLISPVLSTLRQAIKPRILSPPMQATETGISLSQSKS